MSEWNVISKISENFRKLSEDRFEYFLTFSDFFEDFRRLLTISEDLNRNSKMLEGHFKHFATNFRIFPRTSDDFRRFNKNAGRLS